MNPLLKAIIERALKTFLQTFVAIAGTANLFDIGSTLDALSISVSAAFLSILTSLASTRFGANGPSLGGEEVLLEEVEGH